MKVVGGRRVKCFVGKTCWVQTSSLDSVLSVDLQT